MKSKEISAQLNNEPLKNKDNAINKPDLHRSFGTIDLWNRQKKSRTSTQVRRYLSF